MKFDDFADVPIQAQIRCVQKCSLNQFVNIFMYGPGDMYAQLLHLIRPHSLLKTDKRLQIPIGEVTHTVRMSDVHFEIDMSQLGGSAKATWHDIYSTIVDIVKCRPERRGIVACLHFQCIDSDLLDIFYSYMQQDTVRFVLVSNARAFIPSSITTRCTIVALPGTTPSCHDEAAFMCDAVIAAMNAHRPITEIRDHLYNILIHKLDIDNCIWYLVRRSLQQLPLQEQHARVQKTAAEMRFFGGCYRQIYHLEAVVFSYADLLKNVTLKNL